MHSHARIAGTIGVMVALITAGLAGTAQVAAAASGVVGHVYVNDNTAGTNTIGGFDRYADGTLTAMPGSPFSIARIRLNDSDAKKAIETFRQRKISASPAWAIDTAGGSSRSTVRPPRMPCAITAPTEAQPRMRKKRLRARTCNQIA